jgi:hypothetical protein
MHVAVLSRFFRCTSLATDRAVFVKLIKVWHNRLTLLQIHSNAVAYHFPNVPAPEALFAATQTQPGLERLGFQAPAMLGFLIRVSWRWIALILRKWEGGNSAFAHC